MNIIITGASKGIGYQLTKLFCQFKENKVIAIARSMDLLEKLESECLYDNLKPICFDLVDLDGIKSNLPNEISNYIDSVDILINNAGFLINKPFSEFNIAEIKKIFDINFTSPALLMQQLIPFFEKSTVKHVVNVSSMGGFQGSSKFPGLSYYSASKAALANLTESLAEELKDFNIKFNCLAIGAVNTQMLRDAFPGYKALLEPSEMAQFIYDFAINAHKYMNGKIIPVSLSTP